MSLVRRLRHEITKSPLRPPLVWWRHRGLRKNDVLLASYPRSGNTWLRFLLYELVRGSAADFLTVTGGIPDIGKEAGVPLVEEGGRLLKTHEAYRPNYGKAIYLVRDPRDVVISEFEYQRFQDVFPGTFEEFLLAFLAGRVNGYGAWHRHVDRWLDAAESNRVLLLLVKYEDLKKATEATLHAILGFLGVARDDDALRRAVFNNSIERMREKEDLVRDTHFRGSRRDQRFVRMGETGGWKSVLSDEHARRIQAEMGPTMARVGYFA
jgi:Sulfotransferase domain